MLEVAPARGDLTRDHPEHVRAGVALPEDRLRGGDVAGLPGVEEQGLTDLVSSWLETWHVVVRQIGWGFNGTVPARRPAR